jgi:outer membrane autotransporter protein
VVADTAAGRLVAGLTGQFGRVVADIASVYGRGRIATDGYGVGGTLTWYGQSGFYADGQLQATWFTSDLTSDTLGRKLTDGNTGFGVAVSGEAGQRFGLGGGWALTPQAQLVYSTVEFDAFTDPFGTRVIPGRGDSLRGRLGLAADVERVWATGRAKVYGIANLTYEFLDGTDVNVAGVRFANANERLWGGIGAGGTYSWAGDRYALYGEVSLNTSLVHVGDSYAVSGTAGFRMRW